MKVPWSNDEWRRVAVYGLGISGRAATAFLRRHGVEVVALDQRIVALDELGDLATDPSIELRQGSEPAEVPAGVDAVVVSPGIPADRLLLQAARRAGLPVIAEVELAFPFLDGEVVAITGSNGKSTTTALAGEMLRAAGREVEVCGNIGEALTSRVEGAPGRTFVVELSSFQLEAVDRFHPRSAALLNISPDHLDRHHDFASYLAAKAKIFHRQQATDVAVLNARDLRLRGLGVVGRQLFFDSEGVVEQGCHVDGGSVVEVSPDTPPIELFGTADVPLPGPHNLENAMAAALLARSLDASPSAITEALRSFRGLPHRLERVRVRRGVTWYDDSKGTNLAATVRSLEGFADDSVHIILGGQFKGGDLGELRARVEHKARRAYLIGESAERFAQALDGAVASEMVGTLDQAVQRAAAEAHDGEVVLLSPACASFDQFDNFAQRGRVFQRLVRALDDDPSTGSAGSPGSSGVAPEQTTTGGGHGAQARL